MNIISNIVSDTIEDSFPLCTLIKGSKAQQRLNWTSSLTSHAISLWPRTGIIIALMCNPIWCIDFLNSIQALFVIDGFAANHL